MFWSGSINRFVAVLQPIAIIDFGGQVTQRIAKILRKHQWPCVVVSHTVALSDLVEINPVGIILSGGPASIAQHVVDRQHVGIETVSGSVFVEQSEDKFKNNSFGKELQTTDPDQVANCTFVDTQITSLNHDECISQMTWGKESLFALQVPVLGICYGMQLLCVWEGGKVESCVGEGEYGNTQIEIKNCPDFLETLGRSTLQVWMSHRDRVGEMPQSYEITAQSAKSIAAFRHKTLPRYGVQFHPELSHTECGEQILNCFVKDICKASRQEKSSNRFEDTVAMVREQVGDRSVVLALSGGVDSTALAYFLDKVLGARLTCVVVDTGLFRKGEVEEIRLWLKSSGVKFSWKIIDAQAYFLQHLQGILDPEQKRKVVGKCFVEVLMREVSESAMLAQGTIYSDVIESRSHQGLVENSIKTHHNRVEQIVELQNQGRVLEPFAHLFKDEVRELAKQLEMPDMCVNRQPFPGPGLAVRILGEVTREKIALLSHADQIVREELSQLNPPPWQYFAVLTDSQSVGVIGDARRTGNVVAVRAVESVDGMSARWMAVPHKVLERISTRICNEVESISRVVYDITHKPPATIEWE